MSMQIFFSHKDNYNRGFTLVELMVGLVLSVLLIAAIFSTYRATSGGLRSQDLVVEMQQNLRTAVIMMTQELRMAGYDPTGSAGASITVADRNSITFSIVADDDGEDNDGDDQIDESNELKTIEYSFYDAYEDEDFGDINDIGRQVGGVKRAIAENIEDLQFYYMLDGATTPVQTVSATQLNDIRSVQIAILARISRPDSRYTNQSVTYTYPDGTTSGAYADNFRRRFLTKTINMRNMF